MIIVIGNLQGGTVGTSDILPVPFPLILQELAGKNRGFKQDG